MAFKSLINCNPFSTQVQDKLRNKFREATNGDGNINFVTDTKIEECDLNSMATWSSQNIPSGLNLTVGSSVSGAAPTSSAPVTVERTRIDLYVGR